MSVFCGRVELLAYPAPFSSAAVLMPQLFGPFPSIVRIFISVALFGLVLV